MRHSSVRISNSYLIADERRTALEKADKVYGAALVSPDEMGGYHDFTDWQGRPVSQQLFLGRWTFLYFGYSRCQGTCRHVAPMITQAADRLRSRGFPARAAFVDIETSHIGRPRMITRDDGNHTDHYNWPMRFAMSKVFEENGGKLNVLSGNRAQLAAATTAYHVLREHVPPRKGENGMSINHSSIVYILGLDTFVAGYGYHDLGAHGLFRLVEELSKVERKQIDYGAVKSRYLRGACGGDI